MFNTKIIKYFFFAVNDTGLGSEHFGSSSPGSSAAVQAEGVLHHTEIPNHNNPHHLVSQQGNHSISHHQQSTQSTHHLDNDTLQQQLENSTCQIVSSVPAVSVVVNDEDGLMPLEPLSNSDYSYALDEQEDLNELFNSFPF